jgi:hypothetical protein
VSGGVGKKWDLFEGGREELDYQGGAFGLCGGDEGGKLFDVVAIVEVLGSCVYLEAWSWSLETWSIRNGSHDAVVTSGSSI